MGNYVKSTPNTAIRETKHHLETAKLQWPNGPWRDEPDRILWPDPETRLQCMMIRNKDWGNWCGYVGIPLDHALAKFTDYMEPPISGLEVHGGVTYFEPCPQDDHDVDHDHGPEAICHAGTERLMWIGFDCGHGCDLAPSFSPESSFVLQETRYKDMYYVKTECMRLAEQVYKLGKGKRIL